MGRLIVSEFVTLDGVIEAPGHEEHRDGRNAWALAGASEEQQRFKVVELFAADALLLGRVTFQIWVTFWPNAPKDKGFADKINGMPKYVVSTTLTRADWNNTTILRGDLPNEITELKERYDGDILVNGSADVVDALTTHHLVDEYRLLLYPVVLGSGKHLFRDGTDTSHLRLVGTQAFPAGVVLLTYQPADETPSSPFVETFAWTQEQVESWQAAQNAERVLATILFTDIVDSTGKAAELGDREWRRLIDRHDRLAHREVERMRGRLVKSTGDGILATFDAPTRALRCAFELNRALSDLGLEIRSAIHTGEIESRDDEIGGIGVHIASRVLGGSGGGQVVVTRTVRDLATGTDLRFDPLGSVTLRGVPGEWELFRASDKMKG
jgi:class 3 adenylate cyclase/dihydrofolate reductase